MFAKPALIWILATVLFVSAAMVLAPVVLVLTGDVEIQGADVQAARFYLVMTAILASFTMIAAVQLFRLKKAAFWFFVALFVMNVGIALYFSLTDQFTTQEDVKTAGFSVSLSMFLSLYSWYLKRKNVLT